MFHCHEISNSPDLLALHQSNPETYPYLLASNTTGEVNTRYSILMAYPEETHVQTKHGEDILLNINTDLTARKIHTDLPFIGGWFVFLSYEYAQFIEPKVHFFTDQTGLPLAFISRIPAAVILDHYRDCGYIVAQADREELIHRIKMDLNQVFALKTTNTPDLPESFIHEDDPDAYRSQLKRTHQYIRDGDIFQANLSRLWQVTFQEPCNPVSLYQRLRESNPAPFAALVKFNAHYILSSSPERLISVRDGKAETRPIAGTHPRGSTSQLDRELSNTLLKHPKERAEHVMLIDLERNDMGRVCRPGSIQVKDKMILETYQHVHHIVSSIVGDLKAEQSVKDIVHAVFPGGTITGCPKVRCMEIISEMEKTARGAYTGSLGYVSDHGQMDLSILIRTMTLHGSQVIFRAGAGIVSDSITENELNETRHKARGMINAIQPGY